MKREKVTGWKVPLIFCGVVIFITLLGSFFKDKAFTGSPLPQELEAEAKAIKINLDKEGDTHWKEAISKAGSGFVANEVKDARLRDLVQKALEANRLDAACVAIALIRGENDRKLALDSLLDKSLETCALMPWAVFAYKGAKDQKQLQDMYERINSRWSMCRGKLIKNEEGRR